jgi:hypothetical protein
MNAAEQANSLEVTSKIAALVNLFKSELPDIRSDLKPWSNDADTRELVDPDSIDVGFHFPGWSRSWQSRSILVQIRLHTDDTSGDRRAIGIEAAGFDHRGKQWTLSTVEAWTAAGTNCPTLEKQEKLRAVLKNALLLFSPPVEG